VPAPYVLTEDFLQLIPVLHGAQSIAAHATPIVRLTGNVPGGATFGFLALPGNALPSIGGWRSDFAHAPRTALARSLEPGRAQLATTQLPHGRFLELPVTVHGDPIGIRAIVRSPLGDVQAVSLGHTNGAHSVLRGRLPFAHASLAQLRVDFVNNGRITANAGTGIQPSAKGIASLGTLRVDGKRVPHAFAHWIAVNGVSGTTSKFGYVVTPDVNPTLRPAQPTDGRVLPVLATPRIAAAAGAGGIVPLSVEGETIPAHIVGIVKRFPSIVGDAVVADLGQAATRLDTRSPGLGTTDELWLNSDRRPNTPEVTVTSHADELARQQADPLARGALLTLAGTAAVALLLALLGLLLSVVGDVRDERGELFDLEAQGASPATIRAHLRLRAALVAGFGIVGGAILGAILSALVISLVSVTASAERPEPPLRLSLDAPLLLAAALAYIVIAALLVFGATSLRGRAPSRAAEVAS
jgi:hypothetical protein